MPFLRERWQVVAFVALSVCAAGIAAWFVAFRDGGDPSPAAQQTSEPTPPGSPSATPLQLPGDGWSSVTTELVSLDDSPSPVFGVVPNLPECAALQSLESTLFDHEPAFSGGKGQVFERQLADGGLIRVTRIDVRFGGAAAVAEILAAARPVIGGHEFTSCMLAAASDDGIVATVTEGAPFPVAPGGFPRVVRYAAAAESGGGTVTQAVAFWGDGDLLSALFISAAGGPPDEAELAGIALAAMGAHP